MMDNRLSVFQQNIQQIFASHISKIEDNMNIMCFVKKETRIGISTKPSAHEVKVARKHLNCGSNDGVESAKSSIAEDIEVVKNRQKVIKLGDSSQLGWKVMQEYQANPIHVADDLDDDKKM